MDAGEAPKSAVGGKCTRSHTPKSSTPCQDCRSTALTILGHCENSDCAAVAPEERIIDVPLQKLTLTLLGRFEVTGPAGPVDVPSKKLAGLLAYLACAGSTPQPREKLATLLWGSHLEGQARQNLRQALFATVRRVRPRGDLQVRNDSPIEPARSGHVGHSRPSGVGPVHSRTL